MGIRHPWEITLREFVKEVWRHYGIELSVSEISDGILFFRKEGRLQVLPKLDPDEILPPVVIRILCDLYSLPPLDFYLDPEDD
jgi:hypothetical protein